jgi:UDPglucose 6-dehydrogenase
VLKSTLLPGTTEELQALFPDILVLNSPEFLREANAAYDAAHPERNLIGIPEDTERYQEAAKQVLAVLPSAPYAQVLPSRAAELTKYAGNVFLALKVVYANMLSDLAGALGVEYDVVRDALAADPRIGASHLSVLSASGHSTTVGRGAGGHCFIKDLEAFRQQYTDVVREEKGALLLAAVVRKNNKYLVDSGKDLDLLEGVYGADYDNLP